MTTEKSLIGKPISQLSDDELASLSKTIEVRRKSLREAQQKEQFDTLTATAKQVVDALGFEKLPKIQLTPDDTGKKYNVNLASVGVKSSGQRAPSDNNGGKVTINKIGIAKGGIAHFKSKDGSEYKSIQDLVKTLKQPDGTPEADRCWDISKKGISASAIVIKYHADEVTLVYQSGDEQLIKDAVEETDKARAEA